MNRGEGELDAAAADCLVAIDYAGAKPLEPIGPSELCICMTRGSHGTTEGLRERFQGIAHVVIDIDGERHGYDAGSVIALLEKFERGEPVAPASPAAPAGQA